MRRRDFITLLGSASATWPFGALAQQTGKLPTVGFLGSDASLWSPWTAAFVQRLRELGWIEGRTVATEYRSSEGRPERVAEIAGEFVLQKVDVVVTYGGAVASIQAGDPGYTHRVCNRGRSGWQWPRGEPFAPGQQRHWTVAPGDRYCRQAARTFA